jgi:putative FmdB family regulatory protein
MPVYEYECSKCLARFEIQRGFHEEGEVCCPECGGKGQRIYTSPPLIFKGSGFYVTDHKKKEERPAEGQAAKSEAEKPAKKSEAGETKTKPASDNSSSKTDVSKTATKPQPDKQT